MLIQCEKCQTRYNLDEAKIPGKGAKVTCPTCKNVFIVMKDAAAAPAAAPPPAAPTPAAPAAPAAPKSLLDSFFDDGSGAPRPPAPPTPPSVPAGGAARGIRSWKVRVASGLVYDFTDPATLKTWIAERKVTNADQISADGTSWTPIGSIPNLDAFFGVATQPVTNPQMPAAPFGTTNPQQPVSPFGTTNPQQPVSPFGATNPQQPVSPFGATNPQQPAPFTAPGVPPVTGFGPPPSPGAPQAPAFAPETPSMPPPPAPDGPFAGSNPFGAPPPATANPFGGTDPFAAPGGAAPNPFAAPVPPAGAATNPFGADPFASAPNPFGASPAAPGGAAGSDPFAGGPDPFGGAAPAAPAGAAAGAGDLFGGANPFGAAAAPPPPGGASRPAPPPWSASGSGAPPAPAGAPAAPWGDAAPGGNGSAPAGANGASTPALDVQKAPPRRPLATGSRKGTGPIGAIDTGTKRDRRIGRTIGLGVAGLAVIGIAGAIALNFSRIKTAFLTPTVATPAPTVGPKKLATLDGEARTSFLAGRRYLEIDTPAAYEKAAESFRAALEKAPGDPHATAGLLEALALQKTAGAKIEDAALTKVAAETVTGLRDAPNGVEPNRALAQYYVATGHPEQAQSYLDAALATRPDDAPSRLLRAEVEKSDPARAAAAKTDLEAAARDATLTRAQRALAASFPAGSAEGKKAAEAVKSLEKENEKTLAALAAGSYVFTPDETARLFPEGALAASPHSSATVAPAGSATPSAGATASAVAAASAAPASSPSASATGTAAATATATPAATHLATNATPRPTHTPHAKHTATPIAATTPVHDDENGHATPVATATAAEATPRETEVATAGTPTPAGAPATAGAEDHWVAGNALASAGSWPDAVAEYREALKQAPKTEKYQLALATGLFETGKLQESANILARLIEANGSNAAAHRLLGLIYESTGQLPQACAEFGDFLRLSPTSRDAADVRARAARYNCGG